MISFEGDFKAKMQSTTMLLQCVIFTLALNTGNLFIFILNVRFTFPACRQWWCRNKMFALSQNCSHKRDFMHIYSILLTIGHTTHRQGYKFFLAWPAIALLYVIKMMIRTVHEAWVRVFLLSHEQRIHTFCKYTSLPLIVIDFWSIICDSFYFRICFDPIQWWYCNLR